MYFFIPPPILITIIFQNPGFANWRWIEFNCLLWPQTLVCGIKVKTAD